MPIEKTIEDTTGGLAYEDLKIEDEIHKLVKINKELTEDIHSLLNKETK